MEFNATVRIILKFLARIFLLNNILMQSSPYDYFLRILDKGSFQQFSEILGLSYQS